MVIDFEKIAEAHLEGFKGGQGKLDTRNYVDDKVKIMYSTLRPGASTGLHTHEGNCEIIYVVSGTATFHYDDTVEEVLHIMSIINILETSIREKRIIFLKENEKRKSNSDASL